MFNLLAVLAEFEKNLIHERSKAGLEAARARGRLDPSKNLDHRLRMGFDR